MEKMATGIFGGGKRRGGLQRAAGIFADFAAGVNGQAGPYAAMQERRRQEQTAQTQYQQQRADEWADWQRRQQYERDNPAPAAADAFDRALTSAGIDPASPDGREFYRRRAESMARDPNDEFVVVPIPGRGTYAGSRSGMAEALGQASAPQSGGRQPAIGTIEDGYRFRGGDPANSSNWEPVSGPQAPTSGAQVRVGAQSTTIGASELNDLVTRFGPQEVERRIRAGEIVIGN